MHTTSAIIMRRHNDRVVDDVLLIVMCDFSSLLVVFVEIFEFHAEYCSLYLVHAAVPSLISEHVLLGRAIVAQRSHNIGKRIVVCSDSTGIAQCTEILS